MTPEPAEGAESPPTEHQPILRVVKGDLTAEELAALVAVVAARNAAAAHAAARTRPAARSQWGHPTRQARLPHRFGPDLWRRSAFGG
ncbi:acyl-CoA carboxylase epsilon subunit [Aeromicrobium sp.]|uniref:acyl-CoA carboxylase epsilon subunit n=1 Tax=Aeromicrobium sp. TaxID=1871063 RepID=UPI003C654035